MKETGTVTKLNQSVATVKVKRRAECSKCGMCGMKNGDADIDFIASYGDFSVEELSVGDTVTVESVKDLRLISYLLVFLVPIILIGVSLAVGYAFFTETVALILSLGSVAIWYVITYFLDKLFKFGKNYGYKITEIKTSLSQTEEVE